MLPLCRAEGIGVIPWSPLARGLLAGSRRAARRRRRSRAKTDEYSSEALLREADFDVVDRVARARPAARRARRRRSRSPGCSHQPGVTAPIVGASKMQHLEDAVAALDVALSTRSAASLEEPYRPHPVRGHS